MSNYTKEPIVAVITGGHAYDVIGFREMFAGFSGIKAYVQSLDDFASSEDHVRAEYDCIVFYNFQQETPDDTKCTWFTGMHRSVLEELAANDQGILFLHHGLLAYREWQTWSDLIGIQKRTFTYKPDQQVNLIPTAVAHPITAGMQPWTIVDEIYGMDEKLDGEVLLTTDHPESMNSIAWVREIGTKRVFCFASGHDHQTFVNPGFQEVLLRGIHWVSGVLGESRP